MSTQNASPREDMIEYLQIESSILTLTKRCFRLCLGMEGQTVDRKPQEQIVKDLILERGPRAEQTLTFFQTCLRNCGEQYPFYRTYAKTRMLQDMDEVQKSNQQIFKGFLADQINLHKCSEDKNFISSVSLQIW
eukprot:TRINITY_DN33119_c0_g1_i1.p2 TRINITY_DN33119_c0_g1~~TRINITY_DN33119_c0_g1_i1.p2  ORF type:complete len:134 (+),score=10.50 TRINITY_DN33119_c0_g1_i1:78-479(+)